MAGKEGNSYVAATAQVRCSKCSSKSKLKIEDHGVYIRGNAQANASDCSVEPFAYCSKHDRNCVPALTKWIEVQRDVIIDGYPALLKKSKNYCSTKGGEIRIVDDGQNPRPQLAWIGADSPVVPELPQPVLPPEDPMQKDRILVKVNVNFRINTDRGVGPLVHKGVAKDLVEVVQKLKNKKIELTFTDVFRSSEKQGHFRNMDKEGKRHHQVYMVSSRVSPHELGMGVDVSNVNEYNWNKEPAITIRRVFSEHNFCWQGVKDPCHFTHKVFDRNESTRILVQNDWKKNWECIYGIYKCLGHDNDHKEYEE